jgi:hypothetical protein
MSSKENCVLEYLLFSVPHNVMLCTVLPEIYLKMNMGNTISQQIMCRNGLRMGEQLEMCAIC